MNDSTRTISRILSAIVLSVSAAVGGIGACGGLLGVNCNGDDPGCNAELFLVQFLAAARINEFPTHMYVVDGTTNVHSYTIDRNTGLATAGGIVPAGTNPPVDAVVNATGDYLYVASQTGVNGIYAFSLAEPSQPAALSGSPFIGGSSVADLTIDLSRDRIYNVASNQVQGYSIESSTGAISALPGSPFGSACIQAIEYNAAGQYLYAPEFLPTQIQRFSVDANTGTAAFAGASNPYSARSMDFSPDGRFFFATNRGSSADNFFIGSVNAGDGSVTATAGSPVTFGPSNVIALGLDVASDGEFAYLANSSDNTLQAYSVNTLSGAVSPLSGFPLAVPAGVDSVRIAPGDEFLYVGHGTGVTIYSIADSGALSLVGAISGLTGVRQIVFRKQGEQLF